jgi:hypothetical protein
MNWRVQYGRFYLNGNLVFDFQRFSAAGDLDQLSQLQRLVHAVNSERGSDELRPA